MYNLLKKKITLTKKEYSKAEEIKFSEDKNFLCQECFSNMENFSYHEGNNSLLFKNKEIKNFFYFQGGNELSFLFFQIEEKTFGISETNFSGSCCPSPLELELFFISNKELELNEDLAKYLILYYFSQHGDEERKKSVSEIGTNFLILEELNYDSAASLEYLFLKGTAELDGDYLSLIYSLNILLTKAFQFLENGKRFN
jgi:hypothetical protein